MSEENEHLIKIAILETKLEDMKEATRLQAAEYERRLSDLNHAHAQAAVDKGKFLTGELFYSKLDEINKWRAELDQWRSKVIGIAIGLGSVGGLVGGGIAALILRLMK